jgi:hypothetical protein
VGSSVRYLGSAAGFGFGALWMTVGIGSAIACLLLAALGYGVVYVAERAQAAQKYGPGNGSYDEPRDDATSPLAAEAEYGWPANFEALEKPTV